MQALFPLHSKPHNSNAYCLPSLITCGEQFPLATPHLGSHPLFPLTLIRCCSSHLAAQWPVVEEAHWRTCLPTAPGHTAVRGTVALICLSAGTENVTQHQMVPFGGMCVRPQLPHVGCLDG